MKKNYLFLGLFIMLYFFSACEKKDDDTPGNLQGKWTFVSYVTNTYYSNKNHINTITGTTGDYMDFRTDGKLYVRFLGFEDISAYTASGSNNVILDGTDTFEIKKLMGGQLVLYQKTHSSAEEYTEQTYNLKK